MEIQKLLFCTGLLAWAGLSQAAEQTITFDPAAITTSIGAEGLSFTASYRASDAATTAGVAIALYFDSSKLTFVSLTGSADLENFIIQSTATPDSIQNDSDNADEDETTDKKAIIAFASLNVPAIFPASGEAFSVVFNVNDDIALGSTSVNVTLAAASGYVGAAAPVVITIAVDTDNDGEPDDIDTDDDNDGVLDEVDAFRLDATESLDTDGDGVGNNSDTDDDGDGVEDTADALPLDSTETLDTDLDGIGNNADTDDDGDGVADTVDAFPFDSAEAFDTDSDGTGNNADTDDDNDGVLDGADAFPLDSTETLDTDADGVGDNADAFPSDAEESIDTDGDQVGDNADNCLNLGNADQLNTDGDIEGNACDLDDDNDGFRDEEELVAGTDPVSASSCPGCFNWDIDDDGEAIALTDGLIMIRHLFGFNGDSLTAGAIGGEAGRATSNAIAGYLTAANTELDIDGDGESKALTDGLLLIRYLFGFSGDSLISGAIGNGAERDTAEEIEAYIEARLPAL